MVRRYETLMVLHPELPEAQIRETIDRAKRLIEGSGKTHEMQEWGFASSPTPSASSHRGYYVLAEYDSRCRCRARI